MRKGQGSLETLLIIAAVLVIAVAVVLTANYLLGTPTESTSVIDDKFAASLKGAELIGYEKPFDGTAATAPGEIVVNRKTHNSVEVIDRDDLANINGLTYLTSLNGENGTYPVYVASSGGGGGGTAYIVSTPNEADSDNDGIVDKDERPGCVHDPDPNCGTPPGYTDLSADSLATVASYDNSLTLTTIPLGATVELRAAISNKGTANASGVEVKFYKKAIMSTEPVNPVTALASLPAPTIEPPAEPGLIGSVSIASLEAGKSIVVSVPFSANTEENKDFVVVVVPNSPNTMVPPNSPEEKDPDNNVLVQEYTVAYVQPDAYFVSKDITVEADNAHQGDTVPISTVISNKGSAISDMPVELFVKEYVPVGINPPHNPGTALVTMPITGFATAGGSCPANIDYVCGTDDKSYTNACYAGQAGAAIAYKGKCNDGWHYIGQDTIDVGAVSQTSAKLDWDAVEGNYTLIVWADPMGAIDESVTSNNQAESAPFEILEPYSINPPQNNNLD